MFVVKEWGKWLTRCNHFQDVFEQGSLFGALQDNYKIIITCKADVYFVLEEHIRENSKSMTRDIVEHL